MPKRQGSRRPELWTWACLLCLALLACEPAPDSESPAEGRAAASHMAAPDLPTPHLALEAAATKSGLIVFIPGLDAPDSDRILSWSFGDREWRDFHTPAPIGAFAAAGVVGGEVLLCGGLVRQGKTSTPRLDAYRIQPSLLAHRRLPDLPEARNRHAAVVLGQDLYILGGMVEAASRNESESTKALKNTDSVLVWKSGEKRWQEGPTMPTARHGHCAVASEGKIYVIGGDAGYPSGRAPLEIYDPQEARWTEGSPLPEYRLFAEAAVWEGKIYVFGNRSREANSPLRYSIAEDRWETVPGRRVPRQRLAIAVHGSLAFLIGGEGTGESMGTPSSEVSIFDLKTETWIQHR